MGGVCNISFFAFLSGFRIEFLNLLRMVTCSEKALSRASLNLVFNILVIRFRTVLASREWVCFHLALTLRFFLITLQISSETLQILCSVLINGVAFCPASLKISCKVFISSSISVGVFRFAFMCVRSLIWFL